jgi:hypothetical protein
VFALCDKIGGNDEDADKFADTALRSDDPA